ncbi:MAG: serine hydrolase [Candidatus Aminicenantales bacterium]
MRRNRILLATLVIFALFAAMPAIWGQELQLTPDQLRKLDSFIKKQMKLDHIPGLSIGYYHGNFMWTEGYGFADLENRTPAKPNSAYRLASNTKSMTAVAILKLAEQGRLKLDDEIHKYVPYFPWKKWPITIRQLMGHLGGISHYKDYDVEGHIKEHKYTRGALAIFAGFDLVAEPGTKYNYSSYGYNLLGAVVEAAARQSYGDFLREHLWEPLGMKDTRMDDPLDLVPNRVRGYRLVFGELKNSEFVDISSRFAAGGTRSTVPDLLRYAKGLAEAKVLSRRSIDAMETSMATRDGHFVDYGMGWRISPVNGHFLALHTGGQPETRTLLMRFPTMNFALALAYNLEGGSLYSFGRRLYQLLMDEGWNVGAYRGDRISDALFQAVWDTYNYGLAHFDRFGSALTEDSRSLEDAFAYFNESIRKDSLQKDFLRALRRIRDGRHPLAKQAFVKVGSYIASALIGAKGKGSKTFYHQQGALPFFADYIALYRDDTSIPEAYRFSPEFEQTVESWNRNWRKTWDDETRRLHIAAYEPLEDICNRLKRKFRGTEVYPDFTGDFGSALAALYLNGKADRAMSVGRMVQELYPQSAVPMVMTANALVMKGDLAAAKQLYQEAMQAKTGRRAISSGALNSYAVQMFRMNYIDQALDVLRIAQKLYPKEARFYDTMGRIYLEKSRRKFKKALRMNPNLENPWKMLKKIE